MNAQDTRDAVIARIVHSLPGGIGRTALMKLLYFLQVIKGVPLGYNYRLYNYGPFDSEVLEDIDLASRKGILKSEVFQYPGGYGYSITAAEKAGAESLKAEEYEDHIDWVIEKFGHRSASDLEMVSTIIYIDRSKNPDDRENPKEDIGRQVCAIKPHLAATRVASEIDALEAEGLLTSTRA